MMRQCCDNSSLHLKHRHTLLHWERHPPRLLAKKSFSLILQFVCLWQREKEKRKNKMAVRASSRSVASRRAQGNHFGARYCMPSIWIHECKVLQYAAAFRKRAFCTFPVSSRKRKLHKTMSVFFLLPKITDKMFGFGSVLEGEGAATLHAEAASGKTG